MSRHLQRVSGAEPVARAANQSNLPLRQRQRQHQPSFQNDGDHKHAYRISSIPSSYDIDGLQKALAIAFNCGGDDGIRVYSLASDRNNTRTATVSFHSTPAVLATGPAKEWIVEIPEAVDSPRFESVFIDSHFQGFTPLSPVEYDGTLQVDCIAIHGLGGHALGSFRDPGSCFVWLRDSAAIEFEALRVWVYGYDSSLQRPTSYGDIHEYAATFRRLLKTMRKRGGIMDFATPFIFLAHSLGGLLLKEAFIDMHVGGEVEKSLLRATYAVLFFGVPSQGMETSALAAMVDDKPQRLTLEMLDRTVNYRQRERQHRQFCEAFSFRDSRFVRFYELIASPTVQEDPQTGKWERTGTPVLLVSPASASLGRPWDDNEQDAISIQADHMAMVKFSRSDRVEYPKLEEILSEIEQTAAYAIRLRLVTFDRRRTPSPSLQSQSGSTDTADPRSGDFMSEPQQPYLPEYGFNATYRSQLRPEDSIPDFRRPYSPNYMLNAAFASQNRGDRSSMPDLRQSYSPDHKTEAAYTPSAYSPQLRSENSMSDMRQSRSPDFNVNISNLHRNQSEDSLPDKWQPHIQGVEQDFPPILEPRRRESMSDKRQPYLRNGIHGHPGNFQKAFAAQRNFQRSAAQAGVVHVREEDGMLMVIDNYGEVQPASYFIDAAECIRVLRTSDYESDKGRNPDRVPGTCKWFLRHANFQSWLNNETTGLLWVSADPGCGKSVLIRSLAEGELKGSERRKTCYFFFKDDNIQQKTVCNALCALLHQLFCQDRWLVKHALPAFSLNGDKLPTLFDVLWDILVAVGDDPNSGEIVCLLDALDECDGSDRERLIAKLSSYYSAPERAGKRVRFLVTSRPYFDIESAFQDLTTGFPKIRLSGEDETESISEEITSVIKYRAAEIGRRLRLQAQVQSLLVEKLLEVPNRTYLWLHLTLAKFNQRGLTATEVERRIQNLPTSLYAAYESILSKIDEDDTEEARKALNIIVAAQRPLTLREMNTAMTVRHGSKTLDELIPEDVFRSRIRTLCGLFVAIVDSKVYLIHQTAKEFLLGESNSLPTVPTESMLWQRSFTLPASNAVLAGICINYLLLDKFVSNPLSLKATHNQALSEAEKQEISRYATSDSLVKYAAEHWIEHLEASKPADQDMMDNVLAVIDDKSPRFWTWLLIYGIQSGLKFALNGTGLMIAAASGLEAVVKRLLSSEQVEVDAKDGLDRTALCHAAEHGHAEVVRLLLETGKADVKVKSNGGQTPLHFASKAKSEAIVKLLLATGNVEVDAKDDNSTTPLFLSVQENDFGNFKLLFDTGKVDVNVSNSASVIPLHWAAFNGNEEMFKLLLTATTDVNKPEKNGRIPLSYATAKGHETIVKLLLPLSGEADLNSTEYDTGYTPLHYAAISNYRAVIKLLTDLKEVDPNAKDKKLRPPLHHAAINGNEGCVQQLLDSGRLTVLDTRDDPSDFTPLMGAANNGHEAVVRILLKQEGVDINARDKAQGLTPLLLASEYGHVSVLKVLLESAGVDMSARTTNTDYTALHKAADNGHRAVVELLLTYEQMDVNSRDKHNHYTPLHLASMNGHDSVVELLLKAKGVDLDAKEKGYGFTALHYAAANGRVGVTKLLLDTKAVDINAGTKYKVNTPLHMSAQYGYEAITKLLLASPQVNIYAGTEPDDRLPIHVAAAHGHLPVVKTFLEIGVPADIPTKYGLTPLFLARQRKDSKKLCDLLISYGANKNCRDKHGRESQIALGTAYCDGCGCQFPSLAKFFHCDRCDNGDVDYCELCFKQEDNVCRLEKHPIKEMMVDLEGKSTGYTIVEDDKDDSKDEAKIPEGV